MYEDKTIEKFSQSVIRQANLKATMLMAECEKEYEEEINKKKMAMEKLEEKIQQERENAETHGKNALLAIKAKGRKDISEKRRILTGQLFQLVEAEIVQFINSEQYLPWLIHSIQFVQENYKQSNVLVLLRTRDKKYEAEILKKLDIVIDYVEESFVGGCKVILNGNKQLIDMTLDTKLEEAKAEFYGFSTNM